MRIRAILRFKNEDFIRKRLIAGFATQKALASFLRVSPLTIGNWENFKTYPKRRGMIEVLEWALNCEVKEIFPPEFVKAIKERGLLPIEKVIDIKQLPSYTRGEFLLPSPEEAYELKERMGSVKDGIEESLESLTEREAKVLRLRFGLEKSDYYPFETGGLSLEKIGNIFRITPERIRQIEAKALRKLKHPSRSKSLREFI